MIIAYLMKHAMHIINCSQILYTFFANPITDVIICSTSCVLFIWLKCNWSECKMWFMSCAPSHMTVMKYLYSIYLIQKSLA